MIISINEAIKIYQSIPISYKSFYYHPLYLLNDIRNKPELELCFFAIKDSQNIFYHAFYKGKVLQTEYYDIQSPYGYGGPIIIGDEKFKELAKNAYIKWCEDNNILVEFIRFHPILENHRNYYGEILMNRPTVYIDLLNKEILKSFNTRARTAVKKAIKNNLKVTFSKDSHYIKKFIEIYTDLMDFKNTSREYFFDESYYKNILDQDNVYLISALDENEEVIASSIFFVEEEIVEYHLSASTLKGKELCATNLILYEFAKYAQSKKCKVLYLGGGNSSNIENPLLFFKKGFSKEQKSYFIGYTIFLKDVYNGLKSESTEYNNKILFYR